MHHDHLMSLEVLLVQTEQFSYELNVDMATQLKHKDEISRFGWSKSVFWGVFYHKRICSGGHNSFYLGGLHLSQPIIYRPLTVQICLKSMRDPNTHTGGPLLQTDQWPMSTFFCSTGSCSTVILIIIHSHKFWMLQAEQIGPTILHLSLFALMDESNLSAKTAKVHIKVNIILFCVTTQ